MMFLTELSVWATADFWTFMTVIVNDVFFSAIGFALGLFYYDWRERRRDPK